MPILLQGREGDSGAAGAVRRELGGCGAEVSGVLTHLSTAPQIPSRREMLWWATVLAAQNDSLAGAKAIAALLGRFGEA